MTMPEELLKQGVADDVFPAAQAAVIHQGREVFSSAVGSATPHTRFDLASLTKVIATTPLFMKLWARGALGPEAELRRYAPTMASGRDGATLADLLYHRAGLPAFVPFFAYVLRAVPELLETRVSPQIRQEVRDEVVSAAYRTTPVRPSGTEAVYSDVGFILLGELLAHLTGSALDAAFETEIARPLGLDLRFHRLSVLSDADRRDIAPTGLTRPREPAPGQEGLWARDREVPSLPGEVDDDNAWVMDGVAGHAGLFGTAREVARFGQRVLEDLEGAGRMAPAPLWMRALARDRHTPGSSRAMGFDTPLAGEGQSSSAGILLGNQAPGAVGHLGFTGVSLWIDRARSLVVALCSNRTYNGRANTRIRDFRPGFHDSVVGWLGLAGERGQDG
jgi:CubicO group peptidase (beta-lactamase class C family)